MSDNDKLTEAGYLFVPIEITKETYEEFVKDALEISLDETIRNVHVYINSYGGNLDACKQMVDILYYLKRTGKKIITICSGIAASSGFHIFVIGDERKITKYSILMCHRYSGGGYLKHPDLVAARKADDWDFETQINMVADALKWSKSKVKKELFTPEDKWFLPNEALKMNIATEII